MEAQKNINYNENIPNDKLEEIVVDVFRNNKKVQQGIKLFHKSESNIFYKNLTKLLDINIDASSEEIKKMSDENKSLRTKYFHFIFFLIFSSTIYMNYSFENIGAKELIFSIAIFIVGSIAIKFIAQIVRIIIIFSLFIPTILISFLYIILGTYKIKDVYTNNESLLIYENLWKKNSELNVILNEHYTDKEIIKMQNSLSGSEQIEKMKKIITNQPGEKRKISEMLLSLVTIIDQKQEKIEKIQEKLSKATQEKIRITKLESFDRYETLKSIFEKAKE